MSKLKENFRQKIQTNFEIRNCKLVLYTTAEAHITSPLKSF